MKQKSIYHIALTALLAAMTMAMILFARVNLGYDIFHLGDAVILLAAVLLPTPYAMAVGAIGGGMANILSGPAVMWAPATVVIKAAMTVPFSAKQNEMLTTRNLTMLAPYGAITIVGYGLYFLLLIAVGTIALEEGTTVFAALLASAIGNGVQVIGSSVLFIALASVLDKIKFKQRLGLTTTS